MHVLLGSKPPKAARDDYDRFLILTGRCLGGDIPSAELAAAAEALWNAINAVSKANQQSRLSAAALLQPYRCPHLYLHSKCTALPRNDFIVIRRASSFNNKRKSLAAYSNLNNERKSLAAHKQTRKCALCSADLRWSQLLDQ